MLARLAVRNLHRNLRRTLAVLLTVATGTGSLFIFHGFNAGIMNQYRDNTIHARYGYGQINTRGYRDHVLQRPWEHWIAGYGELRRELLRLPGVRQVFPRLSFPALLSHGEVSVSGQGQGVDGPAEARFFDTMNFERGANLTDEPDGIVLGRGLARGLGVGPGDQVTVTSKTVNGAPAQARLRVVGVFHTGLREFDDAVFRIPLAQAQRLLGTDRVETISLGLGSVADWNAVESFVRTRRPGLEATPFQVLDTVYYQHSVDWLAAQFGVIQLIILAILLLGIFNTVSTAVLERRQEIGNLRANGESVLDVLRLLGAEGLVLGSLGALLGIAVALALNETVLAQGILMPPAPGITRQFHVRIELQALMAAKTFAFGCLAAVAGTLAAGLRVSRMPIAEALRGV